MPSTLPSGPVGSKRFRVRPCGVASRQSPPLPLPGSDARPALPLGSRRRATDRRGRLTAEALVTACLDHISARESVVGAWHHLDPEAALAAADSAMPKRRAAAARHPDRGPRTDRHRRHADATVRAIYHGHRPASDAACVVLARAAGAIVLASGHDRVRLLHRRQDCHPRNPAHTPGGSSSARRRRGRRHGARSPSDADRRLGDPAGLVLRLRRL